MGLLAIGSTTTGIRWTTDGKTVSSAPSLKAVLEQLDEPHAFVCEPEFYDGLRDVRKVLEGWLAEGGHRLVPMTRGAREVLGSAGGSLIKGRGVARLYSLAAVGSERLDRWAVQTLDVWDVRDALDVAHAVDLFVDPERALARVIDVIGMYSSLDASDRRALGDEHAYRADVLLAAYRAATVASSREQFERYLGLSSSGRGALTRTIRSWRAGRDPLEGPGIEVGLSWPDYRRALRRVFHLVRKGRQSAREAA